MSEAINWLHLSDFHCGQKDNDWMLRITDEFCRQFPTIIKDRDLPYPNLVIITGDLAFSGQNNEYSNFELTINQIKNCLPLWNPTIIMVPGNHDSNWKELGTDGSNKNSFANYHAYWCKRNCVCWENCPKALDDKCSAHCDMRQLGIACSNYPGDYYWQINIPGKFPFAIIGLNSEIKEFNNSNSDITFERLKTLNQAAQKNGLYPDKVDRKVLIMHHPPFSLLRQEQIFKDIDTQFGNIDICLHGHQHESQSTIRTISGKTEYQYQVASLCGLEFFGTDSERRSFGFTIGSISRHGEIRIWPFVREQVNSDYKFAWDRRLGEERHLGIIQGKKPGVLIRKASRPPFDFQQMARDSKKITLVGLFYKSALISDINTDLFECLDTVIKEKKSDIDVSFILPVRRILKDYSSVLKDTQEKIESHWDSLIRNIGLFFERHPNINGRCLEHNDICPIDGIVFDDEYLVHRILGLPCDNILQSDWNDESFGQLMRAINYIKEISFPMMEFNIYGQIKNNQFHYEGIVPHLMSGKSLETVKGKTFPVAIGLVAYDGCLVLQNRSKRNSGSDFGKISLLANKLIEVDFLDQLTGEQTFQFWNDATIAWRNIDNSTSVSFKDISQQFIQLLGLNSWVIPTNVLLEASKQAMVRCLYSELNLNITKDRLISAQTGYTTLIPKENFSILVSLFYIKLTPEEFNKCYLNDSDLIKVEILNLDSYSDDMNGFILTNLPHIKQIMNLYNKK